MKTITQDFEQALKGIKQIDVIISYADRENTNFIVTQNSEFLITQAQDYLVTESAEVVIDNGGIQNCGIYWNTDILKSVCKMLDLETNNSIAKGTEIFVKIGLLVDDEYEYVDYGSFFTTQDSEKKLDTGTYLTTAYDKMVFFNINASENPLTFEEGMTYSLKQYLEMICNKCGVPYSLGNLSTNANANISIIDKDPYDTNKDVTYRDIIDDITECLGTNFIINQDGKFTNKDLDLTSVMTIDEQNLKDHNVNVGEKKQAIDGIQVYDGSAILNYAGLENSVFIIKNNNIMNAHSSQLLNNVLNKIQGFSYYAFDLDTFGILALEPFDCFTASANNTNYLLCSLHNEINANQGLGEEISYIFKETDGTYEFAVSNDEDKMRNAYIELDKANSQIVLKANANGNIVQAELTADPNDGTSFNVKANNINLEGYTTINNRFTIDNDGYMSCTGATVNGGSIFLNGGSMYSPNLSCKSNYTKSYMAANEIGICFERQDGQFIDYQPIFTINVDDDGSYITMNRPLGTAGVTPVMEIDARYQKQKMTFLGDINVGDIVGSSLVITGSKNRLVQISNDEGVLLSAYETATPYFGDIGSDKTNKEGYCKIMIDDVFAQTIEDDDYKVFIQKCGDGDLYVEKHKDYFEVKGTPNLDFDWELKAIQKDYKDVRLQKKEIKPLKGDDN